MGENNTEILNEDLKDEGLRALNPSEQSSTDALWNCGDGVLQMKPGTSTQAKKDLSAKLKRSRKKISKALTVLRQNLHRESKAKAKESIRNLVLVKSRCRTISRASKKTPKSRVSKPISKSRVTSVARKKYIAQPARKTKTVQKEKPIRFASRSRASTSQSKSSIDSSDTESSEDQSRYGAKRRN